MKSFLFRKTAKLNFLLSISFLFFALTFSYPLYAASQQGLFWCFSTQPKRFADVESCDVYVLGTLHLGLPDAAKFTKDVRQALERSNVLVMEIEPSQLLRPEVAQAVVATQPPFVADWLSDQQLSTVDTYFNSPSASMTFRLSKPWA
ncbi:MAG: TraB/GumN family protein, partial [Pseudomonadota bacterium]